MGLLDSLGGLLSGNTAEGGGLSALLQSGLKAVGGLDGVVVQLNNAGYGQRVNSWLGKGPNEPITADEIRSALGNPQLQAMAEKLGVPMGEVASVLAQSLPQAVDHASPDGVLAPQPGA